MIIMYFLGSPLGNPRYNIYIYDHHMISRCNIHTVTSSYQLLPLITQSTYVETGSVSRLLRIQLSNKVAQKRFTLVGLDGHI